jgi:hypothetical protein
MRKTLLSLALCLVLLAAMEVGLRHMLFHHASYSNSESIDRQLQERDAKHEWKLLLVGDSEVRWGVNPLFFDKAMQAHGLDLPSFNHAFDGFGASWWPRLLPGLLKAPALENVEYVAVGIQLIDSHRIIGVSGEDCGALQRPVLTSAFARDIGVGGLCENATWDATLGRRIFDWLWVVRYSSAVRTLFLPTFMQSQRRLGINSRKEGESTRGFEPHRSIVQDIAIYDSEFARWKAQYQPERDFTPLRKTDWENLVKNDGFFDQVNQVVTKKGRKLILFALPTNPTVIDTFNRRQDYLRNSLLLRRWADSRDVIFVDAGIQDVQNPLDYFSDMRHLSGTGATLYSKKLGELIADRFKRGDAR